MPTVTTCTVHAECVVVDGVEHRHAHPRAPDAPLVKDVEKAEKAAGERLRVAGARTRRLRHELGPAVASLQERVKDAEDRVRLLIQGTGAQIETALAHLTARLSNRERTFLDTAKAALLAVEQGTREALAALSGHQKALEREGSRLTALSHQQASVIRERIDRVEQSAEKIQATTAAEVRKASDVIATIARAETRRLTVAQTEFTRKMADAQRAITTTTADAVRAVADARQEMAAEYASFTTAVDEERVRLATARHAFIEKAERASQDLREEAKEVVRAAHEELKELAETKEALERGVRDLMRSAQAVTA